MKSLFLSLTWVVLSLLFVICMWFINTHFNGPFSHNWSPSEYLNFWLIPATLILLLVLYTNYYLAKSVTGVLQTIGICVAFVIVLSSAVHYQVKFYNQVITPKPKLEVKGPSDALALAIGGSLQNAFARKNLTPAWYKIIFILPTIVFLFFPIYFGCRKYYFNQS